MSSLLSAYTVMQQSDWAGRRFYTARDRRSNQVVYLIAEPAQGSWEPYRQANLPTVEPVALESDTRWFMAALSDGETLEDLRRAGRLTEADINSALLSVTDGLASLSALSPAPVPSYLDPSCIKRDHIGRWTLDYLALAHAPEAHSNGTPPLGVYPMGVLLFWLVTGQTVRRSRVQLDRIEHELTPALQFILIQCLGRVYPSLAELRADLERAGREHEFRAIADKVRRPASPAVPAAVVAEPTLPTRPSGVEFHRVTLGGPQIPINDRPWALPPRPADGFRKFVVPPPPDPKRIRKNRLALAAIACTVTSLAVTGGAAWWMGLIPGGRKVPESLHRQPEAPVLARQEVLTGPELPPQPDPPAVVAAPTLQSPRDPFQPDNPPSQQPSEASKPPQTATPPPIRTSPPQRQPQPVPVTQPPSQVAPAPPGETKPERPTLEPGSIEDLDAAQGGLPVMVHLQGQAAVWAYLIPHPTSPYVSLQSFNRLFGREYLWVPLDGSSIRLFQGDASLVTSDYTLVKGRLWLKLTPPLQQILGVRVIAYTEEGIFFSVK